MVIPAKPVLDSIREPESSYIKWLQLVWTPVFTGVTAFYRTIKVSNHPLLRERYFGTYTVQHKGIGENI